jgi:predicted transcriptional regulator
MDIYLTDREAEVMDVLWKHGAALVAEVRDQLPKNSRTPRCSPS